ncbi:hypothetical protein CMV_014594 [Castanea mollissima]|uniref:Uncharacterized protein n=1 Tax=Castanea mollissima TaxID=60419 RepID=A0A8J4QVW6_9ROSI|nr:hypothetical protein CMV_014594 [Castanea mollissima]
MFRVFKYNRFISQWSVKESLKQISVDKDNLTVKGVLRMWDAVNISNDHDLISLGMILVDKEVSHAFDLLTWALI